MYPVIRQRPSQSLLEAILAIAIIIIAVFSTTTLLVTTIFSGQSSEDKIVAANFAREGIEIVRGIRDSNWMKRSQNTLHQTWDGSVYAGSWVLYDWNYGLDTNLDSVLDLWYAEGDTAGNSFDYIANYDPERELKQAVWPNPSGNWELMPYNEDVATIWEMTSPDGVFYSQFDPAGTVDCPYGDSNCKLTKFNRQINIKNYCADIFNVSGGCDGQYIQVTSTVTWENHGERKLSQTEKLYNWR